MHVKLCEKVRFIEVNKYSVKEKKRGKIIIIFEKKT